jgi:hypothetical protein
VLDDTPLCYQFLSKKTAAVNFEPTMTCPVALFFIAKFKLWLTELFSETFVQVKPIRKASGSEVRHRWEKPLHEVHLQHWGCHGHEHGLQRRPERAGLPPE